MPVNKHNDNSEDSKDAPLVDEQGTSLQAIAPSGNASTPANDPDANAQFVSTSAPPTVDGVAASAPAVIPNPQPTGASPSAPAAVPTFVMVQPAPVTPATVYVEPAKKWAEFEQHWSKWSGKFVEQFDLDASDTRDTKGNRAALALLVQRQGRVLDAIAYQQVDEFVSTLTI